MLIEVRVQLNGTIKDDLDRVSRAIATARLGMRAPDSMTVFGPRFERDEYGHICAVRYRCSDLHPSGNMRLVGTARTVGAGLLAIEVTRFSR